MRLPLPMVLPHSEEPMYVAIVTLMTHTTNKQKDYNVMLLVCKKILLPQDCQVSVNLLAHDKTKQKTHVRFTFKI